MSKSELKSLFTKGKLSYTIRNILASSPELSKLYEYHLPHECKVVLEYTLGSKYTKKLFSVFKEYMNVISADINENLFEKCKDEFLELTRTINETYGTDFDTEFVYQLYVSFLRTLTHFMLLLTFECMGINLSDSNVAIDYGSLGTPGRIAKMWVCKNIYDLTEPLSGRFALEPELVTFPAKDTEIGKPVTVTVTINAVCSHHLVRFGNEFRNHKSRAVISYIPKDKVLGLSKINRWIEWVARRGWLQEELTKYIGETLRQRLGTNDVYVGLINMQHGCVAFRGKNDTLSYTTTEYYSGKYEDVEFRTAIISSLD